MDNQQKFFCRCDCVNIWTGDAGAYEQEGTVPPGTFALLTVGNNIICHNGQVRAAGKEFMVMVIHGIGNGVAIIKNAAQIAPFKWIAPGIRL